MRKILLGLFFIVVVLLGVGLFLPSDFEITESMVIQAPPEKIHQLVGHLDRWPEWTPWAAEDPTIEVTLGGQTTGVGAAQKWTGESGDGELTFTACDAATGIAYDMAFIDGDKRYPSKSQMRYRAVDGGTEVTWEMTGDMDLPVVGGYLSMMMKPSITEMFQEGLGTLKEQAETR